MHMYTVYYLSLDLLFFKQCISLSLSTAEDILVHHPHHQQQVPEAWPSSLQEQHEEEPDQAVSDEEDRVTPPPPYSETAEDGHVSLGRGSSLSPFKLSFHEELLNRSLPTGRFTYPLDMHEGSSLELMEERPAPPLQLPGVPQDQPARLARSLSLPPAVTWSPFLLPSLVHPATSSPWSLAPPTLTLSPSQDITELPRLSHPHTVIPLPSSRLPPLTHRHTVTSTRVKVGRRRRRRHTRTAPEPITMSTVT